jgi:hypothetical protein
MYALGGNEMPGGIGTYHDRACRKIRNEQDAARMAAISQATDDDIRLLAKVLFAADDTPRTRSVPITLTWRDYIGMATAVKAYELVQKAHQA